MTKNRRIGWTYDDVILSPTERYRAQTLNAYYLYSQEIFPLFASGNAYKFKMENCAPTNSGNGFERITHISWSEAQDGRLDSARRAGRDIHT